MIVSLTHSFLIKHFMTMTNPYIQQLVEQGYDRQDIEVAGSAFLRKSFPYTICGRTFQTEEEYNEAIHDFLNGL